MAVSKDNKRILITLPREICEKIEKKAKSENRSLSNYLATIIINSMKEQIKT